MQNDINNTTNEFFLLNTETRKASNKFYFKEVKKGICSNNAVLKFKDQSLLIRINGKTKCVYKYTFQFEIPIKSIGKIYGSNVLGDKGFILIGNKKLFGVLKDITYTDHEEEKYFTVEISYKLINIKHQNNTKITCKIFELKVGDLKASDADIVSFHKGAGLPATIVLEFVKSCFVNSRFSEKNHEYKISDFLNKNYSEAKKCSLIFQDLSSYNLTTYSQSGINDEEYLPRIQGLPTFQHDSPQISSEEKKLWAPRKVNTEKSKNMLFFKSKSDKVSICKAISENSSPKNENSADNLYLNYKYLIDGSDIKNDLSICGSDMDQM